MASLGNFDRMSPYRCGCAQGRHGDFVVAVAVYVNHRTGRERPLSDLVCPFCTLESNNEDPEAAPDTTPSD